MTPQEIRQWRATNKFTPAELADALGVARNTIYRWESGAVEPEAGLAERLILVLAQRETSKAESPPKPLFSPTGNQPIWESRQPHGSVISLTKAWWQDMTDQERVEWIMTAENPLLGIGWPHWSHGYDFWPLQGKLQPTPQDHYLIQEFMTDLYARMKEEKGDEDNKLRRACIYVMRKNTPTWLGSKNETPADPSAYTALKKLMEKISAD